MIQVNHALLRTAAGHCGCPQCISSLRPASLCRLGKTTVALLISALLVGGCVSHNTTDPYTAMPPGEITAASGREQALRDISTGQIQLLEAGTRGIYAPGVPAADEHFAELPRCRLPCGCSTPSADLWVRYAEAYNLVIVNHIKAHFTQ